MRDHGNLVGALSAIRPQPRARHRIEVSKGTPVAPWRSSRLPRTLDADDPRRTLFRSLLRRAEGVTVELADGEEGVVDQVVLRPLGFDFWPAELVVATAGGRRRVPRSLVRRIDVREPRIVVSATSRELLEGKRSPRSERDRDGQRLQRRHDRVEGRVPPRSDRHRVAARTGT